MTGRAGLVERRARPKRPCFSPLQVKVGEHGMAHLFVHMGGAPDALGHEAVQVKEEPDAADLQLHGTLGALQAQREGPHLLHRNVVLFADACDLIERVQNDAEKSGRARKNI